MSEYLPLNTRAVLFDHDDTLVGTMEPKWAQHIYTARKWYNKDLTHDEIRLHWGKPQRELMSILFETSDIELMMERTKTISHLFPKTLYPDTIPVLRAIHEQDIKIGIITSSARRSYDYDIANLKIPSEYIDYDQTEDDTPFHKPDPRVFTPALEWLDKYDIVPGEVTYVGDALSDFKAARAVEFNFIGVEQGLVTHQQFHDAGAISVSSLSQLIKRQ